MITVLMLIASCRESREGHVCQARQPAGRSVHLVGAHLMPRVGTTVCINAGEPQVEVVDNIWCSQSSSGLWCSW